LNNIGVAIHPAVKQDFWNHVLSFPDPLNLEEHQFLMD
jgi:hypothetical protein